jgi:hypothetical protein
MKALAILLALAGAARADRVPDGGAWLHYELSGVSDQDASRPHELVLATARLHGFFGGRFVYHAGIDLGAGATLRTAGFAYDVALFPIGMGVRLGKTGIAALGVGIGASGAVGTLDDAMTVPVELNIEVGGSWRVLARGRATYTFDTVGGQAPSTTAADQLDAMLAVRIGRHYEDFVPSGNGYFAGVAYREFAGARYLGAVIGYSIDLATGR